MLNKNVCPKCGQLFDVGMDKCPLCGLPVQSQPAAQTPVQRRRITEVERRQRRQEQKLASSEARQRDREAKRAADAEAERRLEEEEARIREEKKRSRLERQGYTADEIDRQLAQGPAKRASAPAKSGGNPERVPKAPLVLSIILLCSSILIGGLFLLWRYRSADETPAEDRCDSITLSAGNIEFTAAGQTAALSYTLSPEKCTLPVTFESSNPEVAAVGELGIVTSVAPGSAVITARCGEAEAACTVEFAEPEVETAPPLELPDGLQLSKTDITFFSEGESIYLHVENVPNGTIIEWSSDDITVAVVEPNGHVTATGKGTCNITATVGEYTASCVVRCNFRED